MTAPIQSRPQHSLLSVKGHAAHRVECCVRCLAQGVHATHIIDGRQKHSLLMELLTNEGVGTMLVG